MHFSMIRFIKPDTLYKLLAISIFVTTLNPFTAWSLGSKEGSDFQAVKGLENWNYTYDVTEKAKGKYHLLIKGVDKAGNVNYAGPFNVFVDPDSDTPVVNISYPTTGLRVGRIINLIGTCVDDDGVKNMEVKLDDGDWLKADGKEFWSYRFKLDALPDGSHTIFARGYDINDKPSKEVQVAFKLDKRAPVNAVTSHENGVVVSGKITMEGAVEDKNGVAALYVSYDQRKTFEELRLNYNQSEDKYYFRLEKETTKDQDGPAILWFKSKDLTGSSGYSAFLIFINNQKPALTIIKPGEEEAVNGLVMVSGTARDKIGLKSLTYIIDGTEKGEIKLIPGNPYWAQTFDLKAKKSGTVNITFDLVNLTGNLETKRLKVKLANEADLPVITLLYPQPNTPIIGTVDVVGAVADDDGVKTVEYTLDTGSPVTIPSGPAFTFQLNELTPGKHKLSLRAQDINDVWGNKINFIFESGAPLPTVQITTLDDGSAKPFTPGLLFSMAAQKVKLTGQVKILNGLKKATYTFGTNKSFDLTTRSAGEPGTLAFEIPLGKEIPTGRIDLTINVEDRAGQSQGFKTFFYKENMSDEPAVQFVDVRINENNRVQITEDNPLVGFFSGDTIQSAELIPSADNATVSVGENNSIRIEKKKEGASAPVKVQVKTVSGTTHSSANFVLATDTTSPVVNISSPQTGSWQKTDCSLAGTVEDTSGLSQLEYALDAFTDFNPLKIQEKDGKANFSQTIALTTLEDGPHTLIVRATDKGGNSKTIYIPIKKDTDLPQVQLITPQSEDELNGLFTITGQLVDKGQIENIEFSDNGTQYTSIGKSNIFSYDLNLAKYKDLPAKFYLRVTDASGNKTIYNPVFKINPVADKPVVQIQLPQSGELMIEDFKISGMAFDDDQVQAIYYRIDNQEFTKLPGSNSFAIPIILASLNDNQHTIEVKAEDIGGVMSDIVKSNFWVSKSNPESTLDYPKMIEHVKDIIKLTGTAADPNGIASVYTSLDNGLTFNKADGTEHWSYKLDTRLLQNGMQSLLIKAIDKAGSEGFFNSTINIDNQFPTISLTTPKDGDVFTEKLNVDGKASDNIGLTALSMDVVALFKPPTINGKEVKPLPTLHFNLPLAGIFNQTIDIKELPPGWYNINVRATDKADNSTFLSRNVMVEAKTVADKIEFIYPTPGNIASGYFTISGHVVSKSILDKVTLLMDKQPLGVVEVNAHQYFHYPLGPETLKDGEHVFEAQANLPDGTLIDSPDLQVTYKSEGPWIKIDNFQPGDFATGRPFLKGSAGYFMQPFPEEKKAEDKLGYEAYQKALNEARIKTISLSFDNGKTFEKIGENEKWQYRLETSFLKAGELRILVKGELANGTIAISKTILQVDTKLPGVAMLAPEEGQKFNDKLDVLGTADDENGLESVSIALRQGDKDRYDVPQFIQGLYLDFHGLGLTFWDAGLGLTFFQDNVRLQFQYGQSTMNPGIKYSGYVFAFKLLATVGNIPFNYFLGPDWDFFSMSLAMGANFSFVTDQGADFVFSNAGRFVTAIVGQWEFAKFTIPQWKILKSFGFYTEAQLWILSSDLKSEDPVKFKYATFGLRVNVF